MDVLVLKSEGESEDFVKSLTLEAFQIQTLVVVELEEHEEDSCQMLWVFVAESLVVLSCQASDKALEEESQRERVL